jgi:hypothetical protein
MADVRASAGLIPLDLLQAIHNKANNLAHLYKSFIQAGGTFGSLELKHLARIIKQVSKYTQVDSYIQVFLFL